MARKAEVRDVLLKVVGVIIVVAGLLLFEREIYVLEYKSSITEIIAEICGLLVYLYTIMFFMAIHFVITELIINELKIHRNKKEKRRICKKGICSIFLLLLIVGTLQLIFWGLVLALKKYLVIAAIFLVAIVIMCIAIYNYK